MRLENLYENFGTATPESQLRYIIEYRLRRAEDMAKPSNWPKVKKTKAASKSRAKVELTEEEKTLMTLLGLKKKDIVSLRALNAEEE